MNRKTRQLLLITSLCLVIIAAACGGTNTQPEVESVATAAPAATTAPRPTPTQEVEPTAVPVTEEEPSADMDPEPLLIEDALGNTIEMAEPFQRIISLAPSNTEILFAIGAGDQVVGRDSFSDYPESALAAADIGGGFAELDIETILSLNPDLVLAADITPPEQVQALIDVDLTVYALGNPTDLPGMFANLHTVAMLTGQEAETTALVAELETRVAAVTEAVAGVTERPLVFYELDSTEPNAPWTSGPGTFIDTMLTMAGGDNVGSVLEGAWAQISIEDLIVQDPDIILLGDALWGGVTPEDVAARESWDSLTAVQSDQVFPFDDNLVSRPGPRLVDGLEAMAQFLHPELFN